MTKEIKILHRAVTGIEVNCNHAKKLAEKLEIGSVNDAAMQELGLPLCDEEQIDEFNQKLENADFFFRSGMKTLDISQKKYLIIHL